MQKISFIGIGLMGAPMAINILKKNKLTVFNRTSKKAQKLYKHGAKVAKSLKDAKTSADSPKFYLDTVEETVSTRTELSKLRNRAIVELQKLYDKNPTKLRYVAKVVDVESTQYTASIANDVVYENMDLYINGEGSESNKKRATQTFIEAARSKMEDLKIRALVKDCLYYKFITTKASGWIETLDSSVKLGKRPDECVAFLKNPENEEALTSLLDKVEPYWNA